MKKIHIIIAAIVSLFVFASCESKEEDYVEKSLVDEEEYEKICITGVIDKEASKTSYDINGKMTWLSTDEIALVVNNDGTVTNQNRYRLSVESITDEGRTAVFSTLVNKHQATTGWLSTGFAVYPTGISQINGNSGYDKPFVTLPSSVTGLSSGIILVGTPDNDDPLMVNNFLFKTAMAVVKVTLNNIPSNAASLKIGTNNGSDYPVDGDFSLVKTAGVVTIASANYLGSGNGYQSVAITEGSVIDSRDFYFNLPVTEYPANTLYIQLLDANGGQIMKRTIKQSLNLVRNECLTLPELTLSHICTIGGDVQTPRVVWSIDSKQVLFNVNQSSVLDLSEFPDTYKFTNGTDTRYTNAGAGYPVGYAMTALTPNPFTTNGSGQYYLHYVILSSTNKPTTVSDSNVVNYGSVPFYFLSSSDATALVGSYTQTSFSAANWFGSGSHNTVVKIAASPDITKGCVALTHFLGRSYNLTEMAGGASSSNVAGAPVFGSITGSTLTFFNVGIDEAEGYFFTDYNSEPFIVTGGDESVAVGSGAVSAATDTNDFSYTVDTSSGTVLTNTGLIVMKFLWNSNHAWTRFWTVQNQVLTKD